MFLSLHRHPSPRSLDTTQCSTSTCNVMNAHCACNPLRFLYSSSVPWVPLLQIPLLPLSPPDPLLPPESPLIPLLPLSPTDPQDSHVSHCSLSLPLPLLSPTDPLALPDTHNTSSPCASTLPLGHSVPSQLFTNYPGLFWSTGNTLCLQAPPVHLCRLWNPIKHVPCPGAAMAKQSDPVLWETRQGLHILVSARTTH